MGEFDPRRPPSPDLAKSCARPQLDSPSVAELLEIDIYNKRYHLTVLQLFQRQDLKMYRTIARER